MSYYLPAGRQAGGYYGTNTKVSSLPAVGRYQDKRQIICLSARITFSRWSVSFGFNIEKEVFILKKPLFCHFLPKKVTKDSSLGTLL
ncbi:hypothetical protein [Olivibacter jilunii]|uniref:hypothetical protein n=1 Tax=Olivibacter jilunii TaxID=985016 RepID=UPI003F17694A